MAPKRVTIHLLRAGVAVLAAASPILTGAVQEYLRGYLLTLGLALGIVVALWRWRRDLGPRLLLSIVALCLGLSVVDVIARPVLAPMLHHCPHGMYFHRFPPLPLLYRYDAKVSYVGRAYGDLAAPGDRQSREYRTIRFVTDDFGFRNEPPDRHAPTRDLDVVILGDSFGVGIGTTQERTWATILRRAYGLEVYNLSMPGSPWHEYVNLAIESSRLRMRKGTVVIWALFPANDLDEPYYHLDLGRLPWRGPVGELRQSLRTFRERSPLRDLAIRLRLSSDPHLVIARDFGGGRLLFLSDYTRARERTRQDIQAHPNFRAFVETFGAVVRLAALKQVTLAVLVVPSKEEVYAWVLDEGPPWSTHRTPSAFSSLVEEMSTRAGLPFLDLKPFLIDASKAAFADSGQLLWWRDDSHWNDRGHATVAALVYERLLAALLKTRASAPVRR